jgi:serine/threonine-protein kinase
LKPLARRNALQVDHDSFNADSQRLISQLELALSAAERARTEKARWEREAHEKKAAEEKRAQEADAKAAREREEREQKEREERAQKEKEAREKAVAEEKARIASLRKQRQKEFSESIKNIFLGRRELPFFIGGGIIILFLLGNIIRIALVPSTQTPIPTSTEFQAEIPHTSTPAPGIGNTTVSPIDGMTMVFVPAGEFQMCSEDGEDDEKPVHTVYLDAFWIDQTEVTNTMYARCVEAGACGSFGSPEIDDYPVSVLWQDARNYCEWVNRRLRPKPNGKKQPVERISVCIPGVVRSMKVMPITPKVLGAQLLLVAMNKA